MAEVKLSLEETTKKYLDRRGGVVVEHLVAVLKRIHDKDAPELESEAEFKEFLASKPDVFRIAVSVNNVERARLTSPRRASKGLIGLTISVLTDQVRPATQACCISVHVRYISVCDATSAMFGHAEVSWALGLWSPPRQSVSLRSYTANSRPTSVHHRFSYNASCLPSAI